MTLSLCCQNSALYGHLLRLSLVKRKLCEQYVTSDNKIARALIHLYTFNIFKDRHQWWRRESRCSLSLSMDKLFSKAINVICYISLDSH